jgi:hypothetical protein
LPALLAALEFLHPLQIESKRFANMMPKELEWQDVGIGGYFSRPSPVSCRRLRSSLRVRTIAASFAVFFSCSLCAFARQLLAGWDPASGTLIINKAGQSFLETIESSTNSRPMKGTGLAMVRGEVHFKVNRSGTHDALLPLPQLTGCQAPVCYSIRSVPDTALVECRLQKRADGNAFVSTRLKGEQNQELKLSWTGVVLIANKPGAADSSNPEDFLQATGCVQATDDSIKELAGKLWPASGRKEEFAVRVQKFIGEMKQKEQPRSLDALGIMKSGGNWICTANANLACALMRARQIPCRAIAVVPPSGQRLEMHRVAEFFDGGKWIAFDPSLLHDDIPLKSWQSLVMERTSIPDEQKAMKPRFGTMLGCPYGQEFELAEPGLMLFGNDFYWTIAVSLAEFDVSEEASALATAAWKRFESTGETTPAQIKAAFARHGEEFITALKSN